MAKEWTGSEEDIEPISPEQGYSHRPEEYGTQQEAQPMDYGQMATNFAPDIGAAAGGIFGTMAGGPVGAYAGTAAGTTAGLAAQRYFSPPEQDRPYSEWPLEVGKQTAFQGVGDLAGWALNKIIGGAIRAKPQHILPGAQEAQGEALKAGTTLTPQQVVREGTGLAPALEGAAFSSRFGSGTVKDVYAQQQEVLSKQADDLFGAWKTHGSRYDLSREITKFIKDGERQFRDVARQDYANLDNLASQLKTTRIVPTTSPIVGPNGQQIVINQAVTDSKIVNMGNVQKAAKSAADMFELNSPIQSVLRQVENAEDHMSFMEAHTLRSDLSAVMRNLDESSKRFRAAKMVKEALDQRMEASARQGGGRIWQEYQRINKGYREGMETFTNDTIVKLAKEEPLALYNSFIKTGNIDTIDQIKKAIFSTGKDPATKQYAKELWDKTQDAYLQGLIIDAKTADKISGKALMNNFTDLDKKETMSRFLTKDKYETFKKFAQFAEAAERRPKNTGILMQMVEAGALFKFAAAPLASGAILIAPKKLAKLVTDPKFVNAVMVGSKYKSGTAVSQTVANAIRLVESMAGEANRAYVEETTPQVGQFGQDRGTYSRYAEPELKQAEQQARYNLQAVTKEISRSGLNETQLRVLQQEQQDFRNQLQEIEVERRRRTRQ